MAQVLLCHDKQLSLASLSQCNVATLQIGSPSNNTQIISVIVDDRKMVPLILGAVGKWWNGSFVDQGDLGLYPTIDGSFETETVNVKPLVRFILCLHQGEITSNT